MFQRDSVSRGMDSLAPLEAYRDEGDSDGGADA